MVNHRTTDTAARLGADLAPDFRLVRPLGEGAMACVYLAREVALERLVAVKVLREEYAGDDTASRRFQREARSAARIVHPSVTTVHRVGELGDGTPYLVLEYVDGRTLADRLAAEGPLEPERAREVLAQLAAALAAAHEQGIVHRDVRPGNVLVEKEGGRVVLTDFGIAAVMESGSGSPTRLTPLGEVLGDPRYLSPEQLLGEPLTEQADVYSLGVVGYELLTGKGPYPGETGTRIVTDHLQSPPFPLGELRPDVPEALAALLERCLAKRPEHRPRAADVARTLAEPAAGAAPDVVTVRAREVDPPVFPALAAFLQELKRRRVYRTAATYLVAAFVVLEGADIVLPTLPVPEWTLRALVAAALAGFPVVLVLTWIFDLTRSGIRRTESLAEGGGTRAVHVALQLASLGVSVLVAALVGWWMLGGAPVDR